MLVHKSQSLPQPSPRELVSARRSTSKTPGKVQVPMLRTSTLVETCLVISLSMGAILTCFLLKMSRMVRLHPIPCSTAPNFPQNLRQTTYRHQRYVTPGKAPEHTRRISTQAATSYRSSLTVSHRLISLLATMATYMSPVSHPFTTLLPALLVGRGTSSPSVPKI